MWPCPALTAKAPNRSVGILLQSLLWIQFMKEKDLSAFHFSNRGDLEYLQFSRAWGKCSVKCAANVASACWFKTYQYLSILNDGWRIQRHLYMINLSWRYAYRDTTRCHFSVKNWLSLVIVFSSGSLTTSGMSLQL